MNHMESIQESVHVHWSDAKLVIDEYSEKGYTLIDRTKPTIIAQIGFVRLVFYKSENLAMLPGSAVDPSKIHLR